MIENIYNFEFGHKICPDNGYISLRKKIRVKMFSRFIAPNEDEFILDIGCNKGDLVKELIKKTKNVYGIDVNEKIISNYQGNNLQCMSATDLKYPKSYFDKVCSFEVLEHIFDIQKVFKEVHRVLVPGGRFIISFPLELIRGQNAIFDSLIVYKHPFMARKLHVHKLSPKKIKELISDIPFEIIKSKISFLPFPLYIMILKKNN